jgi:hypothetical protein
MSAISQTDGDIVEVIAGIEVAGIKIAPAIKGAVIGYVDNPRASGSMCSVE